MALVGLAAVKLGLAVGLYDAGRVWMHQDDYCRSLMAVEWGRAPYPYPSDLHWLPLPFYVYGLASRIDAADPQLLFVCVSQALSVLTMAAVYGLGATLFSPGAGLFAAALYTLTAWQAVMSFSALAEPVYYFVVLCGVWRFAVWHRSGRIMPLAGAALFMALACLTRYEAWLLLIFLNGIVLVRGPATPTLRDTSPKRKRGSCAEDRSLALPAQKPKTRACPGTGSQHRLRPRAVVPVAMLLSLSPWLAPVLWMAVNLHEQGVLLSFYGANRQAFTDALYGLGAFQRAVRYPAAFVMLSVPLTVLLVAAFIRFRAWGLASAGWLAVLSLGHLAAMTVLYISGSGPMFVERIVLVHLLLLIPIGGGALMAAWSGARPAARAGMVALLVAFGTWEGYRAHEIIQSQRYSDYRETSDAYQRLSAYLRTELPGVSGAAAVHCRDNAHYTRFASGMDRRIIGVTGEDIPRVLAAHDVAVLCVLNTPVARWEPDGRVEAAFRGVHADDALVVTRLPGWRIVRVDHDAGE